MACRELYVTKIQDEDTNIRYEFKDKSGQILLTRQVNGSENLDTYYVYDIYGNLRAVLPPLASDALSGNATSTESTVALTKYGYLYKYDVRNRCVVLSDNTYDAFGRLQTEKTGGILTTTYVYDVRSRLTKQNNTQYIQDMAYTYGSNVQWISWQSKGMTRKYEYAYDGLSRLTSAAYTLGPGNFSTSYTYDKHGNPFTIRRYGMTSNGVYGLVDDLTNSAMGNQTLTYDGNQLVKAIDSAPDIPYSFSHDFKSYINQPIEYTYNSNGSMTKDLNRGISSIQYNVLNLPSRIDIKSPVGEARNEYVYRGDGGKLRVIHRWNPSYSSAPVIGSGVTESSLTSSETMDYAGNYIYVNKTLKRTLTENGYIENNVYFYNVKDHLGSTRLVINQSGTPVQSTNYYPFGMQQGDATGTEGQPYKYTGKEYDRKHGLNLYDYGARFFDPGLGRITTIDPLAEKYYSVSPYAYCANNPVNSVDLKGDSITVLNLGEKGEHIALLIQNDVQKWAYYSFNGVPIYNMTNGSLGGRGFDDMGEKVFDNPQQFLDSDYNQEIKNRKEKDNPDINAYGYPEGYILPTTSEQDIIVKNVFRDVVKIGYSLFSNQCATAVQVALHAISVDTSVRSYDYDVVMGIFTVSNRLPYQPSSTFNSIMKNNPNGIRIYRK